LKVKLKYCVLAVDIVAYIVSIYYILCVKYHQSFHLQVHLVKSEDFYGSPLPTLNQLFTFLNISTQSTERLIQQKGSMILVNYVILY